MGYSKFPRQKGKRKKNGEKLREAKRHETPVVEQCIHFRNPRRGRNKEGQRIYLKK